MQSREEEQSSQTQHEETEVIQHSETQEQGNDPKSSDWDTASIPFSKECDELKDTDKCLITVNHKQYEQRVTNLQDLILNVRQELKEEKEWWDTQIAELKMKVLDYSPDYLDYCSSPKEAISMDVHTLESPATNSVFNFALDNKESMDYERKLKCYQEALTLAQFEKHQNMKRQLAAHAYKKKLLEIEQLCNVELSRIRQNTSLLEPLNKMASEWKLSSAESTGQKTWKGDSHFSSYLGKIPKNLCDMNCNTDENYDLGLYGEACKGDVTACLNLISDQYNGLNEALVQNEKCSANSASIETLNAEDKLQKSVEENDEN